MIVVHLSAEQRTEVARVSRQAVGRVARRAQLVLRSDRGCSVPRIARIHGCGRAVGRPWLHRDAARGAAGLDDEPRGGRPRQAPLAPHRVDAQAGQPPTTAGPGQTGWPVARRTRVLAERFRLARSRATGRRRRAATGGRWGRPRLAPASARRRPRAPDAEATQAASAAARRAAARGRAPLRSLDGRARPRLPVRRAMGMTGPRGRLPTPGTTATRACVGALDAAAGAVHRAAHARQRAVHCGAFLQRVADASPTGRLVVVLDDVQPPDAKAVRAWLAANPRVRGRWLPTDAGHEANPVERLWGVRKGAVAADRLAGSIDEWAAAARRFLAELAPHPVPLPEAA
jgi:transposase